MIKPELLGPVGMVMAGDMICGEWEQSSMPVVDKAGVGIRMGSTELVGGGWYCFGVAPNAERIWLVVGVEANPAVNMTVPHQRRVQEMGGDLGNGGPLGGMIVGVDEMARVDGMAGVDGIAGVNGMVGTRVVSDSSP